MAGRGKRLAVLTSGGDAQGMNAALRAVVRLALYQHAEMFYVMDGYKGLIEGRLEAATWESVANVIQTGGTFIGSARSKEFTTREGRLKAAATLARYDIDGLVCIGGDGSLTGLQMLQSEWASHMTELIAAGTITIEKAHRASQLAVVGLVGSIDNDFAASDMTIGADSALTRIVEAIDAVVDTANSHQRTFVIEVMGRQCGYLALTAALATEADFVFVPEWPPDHDWPATMCDRLAGMRKMGRRLNVVIVAEGAMDDAGRKITPEMVQKVVEERLKFDTRVTKLGHVQRGGKASFLDRLLGTRLGAEAVATVLDPKISRTPCVITVEGNKLKRVPLDKAIERNQMVAKAFKEGDHKAVIGLRGKTFAEKVEYLQRTRLDDEDLTSVEREVPENAPVLAVMHVGAPAAGMNAVTHAFVRYALADGYRVYGIHDSFVGLAKGNFEELSWSSVAGWVSRGGSMLGTKKERPEEPYTLAGMLERYGIKGLLIVGGFEAFSAALSLAALRPSQFGIPIVVVPATISNNVPGTRVSIGSDTALNETCRLIDAVKQSARGTRGRAFIVETQGAKCGYLAAMGGIAGAADAVHIFEEHVKECHVRANIQEAERRVRRMGSHNYLLVRGEGCHLSSQEVLQAFQQSDKMSTRLTVFGHVLQGTSPSVFDRQMGLRMGAKAFTVLAHELRNGGVPGKDTEGAFMIGLNGSLLSATPCHELRPVCCFAHRTHTDTTWWRKLTQLARTLASDEPMPIDCRGKKTRYCSHEVELRREVAGSDCESDLDEEGAHEDAKWSPLVVNGAYSEFSFEEGIVIYDEESVLEWRRREE